LAERDAGGVFEDVAEIPEHGEVGVLPEDNDGGGEEEQGAGEEIGGAGEAAAGLGIAGQGSAGHDLDSKIILRQF
jgi:hypothetical protein